MTGNEQEASVISCQIGLEGSELCNMNDANEDGASVQ